MNELWKAFQKSTEVYSLREEHSGDSTPSRRNDIMNERADARDFVRVYTQKGMDKHISTIELPLLLRDQPDGFFYDIQIYWIKGFDISSVTKQLIAELNSNPSVIVQRAIIDHLSYIAYLFGNGEYISSMLPNRHRLLSLEEIGFSSYEHGNLFQQVEQLILNSRMFIHALTNALGTTRGMQDEE